MRISFNPNDPRDVADTFNHLRAMGAIDEAVQVHVSDVPVNTVPAPLPVGAPTPGVSPSQALAAVGSPVAPVVEGAVPAGAVELDTNGMPWNEAYHSGGQTKTGKGVWKSRSGKSAEAKAALTAHLTNTAPVPAAPVAAPVPAAPVAAPVAAALPAATLPTPAPAAPTPVSYDEFAQRFVGMLSPNATTGEEAVIADAQAFYTAMQITDTSTLQTDADLRVRAWQYLDQLAAA